MYTISRSLFIILLIYLSSCKHSRDLESERLESIQDFKMRYESSIKNKHELGALIHSNVLEKLRTLNLKEFNEPLYSCAFLTRTPDHEYYSLVGWWFAPDFTVDGMELSLNGNSIFLPYSKYDLDVFNSKEYSSFTYGFQYLWKQDKVESQLFTEALNSKKWDCKVRLSKAGKPVADWFPVAFFDRVTSEITYSEYTE